MLRISADHGIISAPDDAERNQSQVDRKDRPALQISGCKEQRNKFAPSYQKENIDWKEYGGDPSHHFCNQGHNFAAFVFMAQAANRRNEHPSYRFVNDAQERELK